MKVKPNDLYTIVPADVLTIRRTLRPGELPDDWELSSTINGMMQYHEIEPIQTTQGNFNSLLTGMGDRTSYLDRATWLADRFGSTIDGGWTESEITNPAGQIQINGRQPDLDDCESHDEMIQGVRRFLNENYHR